jgi:hypothetical protein
VRVAKRVRRINIDVAVKAVAFTPQASHSHDKLANQHGSANDRTHEKYGFHDS